MVEFNAPFVVFTSNIDPQLWYPWASQAHRDALWRRFDKIEEIKTPFVYNNTMHPYIDLTE